jgi:divalent metal cation (Fe/Co/Zn/Cd) transporter
MSVKHAHKIATRVEEQVRNRYGEKTNIVVHVEPCENVDEIIGGI